MIQAMHFVVDRVECETGPRQQADTRWAMNSNWAFYRTICCRSWLDQTKKHALFKSRPRNEYKVVSIYATIVMLFSTKPFKHLYFEVKGTVGA